MSRIYFKLEEVESKSGATETQLVKYVKPETGTEPDAREEWGSMSEFDRLFDACVARWPAGWDIDKLITAVRECAFD